VGGWRAVVGLGRPPEHREVHRAALGKLYPLSEQERALYDGPVVRPGERDPARRIEHAPPGNIGIFRKRRESPADRARGPGPTGEPGHETVRGDAALGDVAHYTIDAVIERIHILSALVQVSSRYVRSPP